MVALVYLVADKDSTYLAKQNTAFNNLPTTSPDDWPVPPAECEGGMESSWGNGHNRSGCSQQRWW